MTEFILWVIVIVGGIKLICWVAENVALEKWCKDFDKELAEKLKDVSK